MRQKMCLVLAALVCFSSLKPAQAISIFPSTTVSAEPDPARVKAAVEDFKSLSKKEKRQKIKSVKKEIKNFKAEKKKGSDASTNTLLLVILAILLPPLAVYLYEGEINNRFWISLLLTLLFWVPGIIYALILILGNE